MKLLALLALVTATLTFGCSSKPGDTELAIAPGQYAPAFDAAKETLRDWRFQLERVDGAAGVITTQARTSGGFATPFDPVQSTAYDKLNEMNNRIRRRVRITFEGAAPPPEAPAAADGTAPPADELVAEPALEQDIPNVLIAHPDERALTMKVAVTVERVHIPGWRLSPAAVHTSSRTFDPALAERGLAGGYAEVVREDTALAARLLADIRSRLSPEGE